MKITRCDCCGKTGQGEYMDLVLPIIKKDVRVNIVCKEMDVCEKCAYRIMDFYYRLAEENGFSGIRAI